MSDLNLLMLMLIGNVLVDSVWLNVCSWLFGNCVVLVFVLM